MDLIQIILFVKRKIVMMLKKLNILFCAVVVLALPFYAHAMEEQNPYSTQFRTRLAIVKRKYDDGQQRNHDAQRNIASPWLSGGQSEWYIKYCSDIFNASNSDINNKFHSMTQDWISCMVTDEKDFINKRIRNETEIYATFKKNPLHGLTQDDLQGVHQSDIDDFIQEQEMNFSNTLQKLRNHFNQIDAIAEEVRQQIN
jgi:hypothetical protein